MARKEWSHAALAELSAALAGLASKIDKISSDAKAVGLPSVWVHADTIKNKHLPAMEDFVDKMRADVNSQLRANERRNGEKKRGKK